MGASSNRTSVSSGSISDQSRIDPVIDHLSGGEAFAAGAQQVGDVAHDLDDIPGQRLRIEALAIWRSDDIPPRLDPLLVEADYDERIAGYPPMGG